MSTRPLPLARHLLPGRPLMFAGRPAPARPLSLPARVRRRIPLHIRARGPRVLRAALTVTALAVATCLGISPSAASATASATASGSFSVLSYNVAGLPDPLSGSDPATNTPLISARLGPYDVVHVQEDFNYHAALYASDNHAYRTPTSGGVPFGSGLNTLSHLPYSDLERVTWDDCFIGTGDCLTPKGFTFTRIRLAEGVYTDFYNLHADAGNEDADLAARRKNLLQLSAFIQSRSAGNAVIVYGDTNTRYTRAGDNIRDLAAQNGLTDVWVELVRGGTPPAAGSPSVGCDAANATNACEVVDKILYRSSRFVTLTATAYDNEHTAFLSPSGGPLSDHYPIMAGFSWTTNPAFQMSDQFGGPHGGHFSDIDRVAPGARAATLSLRTGARVDQIGLTLADGTVLAHGGTGGGASSLTLGPDEYATSLHLCRAKKDGDTRIFYARFTTNLGRALAGGTTTPDCTTLTAPPGWQIAGFHGRSGTELDKTGVIYTRTAAG